MVRRTIPVNDPDHTQGPQDAPVVLVVKRLQQRLGGRLRFFRNFPLVTIHPFAGAQSQF